MNDFIFFDLGFLGLVQNRLYLFLDSFVWFYFKEANDCVSLVVQTKKADEGGRQQFEKLTQRRKKSKNTSKRYIEYYVSLPFSINFF